MGASLLSAGAAGFWTHTNVVLHLYCIFIHHSSLILAPVKSPGMPADLRTSRVSEGGFALVVTVSMMVLLLLLCVSLLSLSTISLKQTNQRDSMLEAQANARMALMMAIGELQEALGPDRRITGRAEMIARDPRVGVNLASGNPRSWWVGVAGSDPTLGLDARNPVSGTNPGAIWLVSGLDPSAGAAAQLGQNFANPVILFGEHSIDLSLTGGQPLEAGIVRVEGGRRDRLGGYAWMIDDEGLKAALAPGDSRLVNSRTPVSEGDLTPGGYDLSVLDGMAALAGNPLSNYAKILSTADLVLIGGTEQMAANKRLSYTTYSRGVLCDVKHGGLKRDLTAAFENNTTFAEVFPRGSGSHTADYLCIDPAKLAVAPDLQQNGYIHWEVFKDHYNIKRHLKTAADGTVYLDPVRYSKDGPFLPYQFNGTVNHRLDPLGANGWRGCLFTAGRLGPHAIGDSEFTYFNGTYNEMMDMPYGDYRVAPTNPQTPKNHHEFKHSPVIPILQRFQANAWMEQLNATTLRTHAQIWSSHYNPYNVALYVAGNSGGARMLGTPSVRAYSRDLRNNRFRYLHENQNATGDRMTSSSLDNVDMNSYKFEFHSQEQIMLQPGRSHVMAYEDSTQIGVDRTMDGFLYSEKVKDLTVQSVYRDLEYVAYNSTTRDWDIPLNLPASYDMEIRLFLMNASLCHGVDDNYGGPGNFELHQTFWAPFGWERVSNRPGKLFDLGRVTAATLNENKMASLAFNLRTTREADGIRPLVDANIRCLFGNTRWDSPLNVPLLAAYSPDNDGEAEEMVMQMSTVDNPRGYSYWGAGRDPSFGYERVILFDIPRTDLVSLGQLQHAGAGRFSYEPTYIVGNSYANPRISPTNWVESVADTFSTAARGLDIFPITGNFNLYDASYLVNEVLWDGYAFTTIPQVADNLSRLPEPAPDAVHFADLVAGNARLPQARYLPYVPEGSSFDPTTLQMASNRATGTGAFYHNAGHVLVDGAFNVNSTSVDAWEAFLSGTHSLPVARMNEQGEITGFRPTSVVRFPRVQTAYGEGVRKGSEDENFWIGFRELEQAEVRALAEAIVSEVTRRGPFLSMADFVNRKLVAGGLGEAGALQAALDDTVNAGLDADVSRGEQAAGFPGQLLQGDVLQALAPRMTVRSDVFTIRAYGESVNATSGEVLARAWCEATVQRFPDPVDWGAGGGSTLSELTNPSSPFGREFRLISFRWLNPAEI